MFWLEWIPEVRPVSLKAQGGPTGEEHGLASVEGTALVRLRKNSEAEQSRWERRLVSTSRTKSEMWVNAFRPAEPRSR
jgi:hypothetical protein